MQTALQRIREKCLEAGVELCEKGCTKHWPFQRSGCKVCARGVQYREIRLADVLLAHFEYMKAYNPHILDTVFRLDRADIVGYWNLREDDLEKQSPETVEFIGKMLGV